MVKKLFHLETSNGRGHYQILGAAKGLILQPIVRLRPRRGIIKVDAGQQGAIFLASFHRDGTRQFVIKVCPFDKRLALKKQVPAMEYLIEQKLYKVVPTRIPKPLGFFYCNNFIPWKDKKLTNFDYSKQSITCMEYIENGTFGNYLNRLSSYKRLSDPIMRSFITQVLRTILKIQSRYPKFRHGDLHLNNLLVRPAKPIPQLVLTDFGWSRLYSRGVVDSAKWKESHGLGPKMSNMYDIHLFLTQLRNWVIHHTSAAKDGFQRTIAFLDKFVPTGYRDENDIFTRNYRLKYGIKYPFTIRTMLNSMFLRTGRGPIYRSKLDPAKTLLAAYGVGPTPYSLPSLTSATPPKRKSPKYSSR